MPLTVATPLSSVHLRMLNVFRTPVHLRIVTDEDTPQTIDITWDDLTGEVTSGSDDLDVLRTLYASDDGFVDSNGDAVSVTLEDTLSVEDVEDLVENGWVNPFLDPDQPAAGNAVTIGYNHFAISLWQDVTDGANEPAAPPTSARAARGNVPRSSWGAWDAEHPSDPDPATGMDRYNARGFYSQNEDGSYTEIQWEVSEVVEMAYSVDQRVFTSMRDTTESRTRSQFFRTKDDSEWKAWQRLEDSEDGWFEPFRVMYPYRTTTVEQFTYRLDPDPDLSMFHEMEIEVAMFGAWDDEAFPERYGASGRAIVRRPPEGWSKKATVSNFDPDLGTYKVELDDIDGLSVVQVIDEINEEQRSNVTTSGEAPERRASFFFHLLAKAGAANGPNDLQAFGFSDFPGQWAKTTVRVRFR